MLGESVEVVPVRSGGALVSVRSLVGLEMGEYVCAFLANRNSGGGGMEQLRSVCRMYFVLACFWGAIEGRMVAKVVMEIEGLEYGKTAKHKSKG